jgi:hypothetical protein
MVVVLDVLSGEEGAGVSDGASMMMVLVLVAALSAWSVAT